MAQNSLAHHWRVPHSILHLLIEPYTNHYNVQNYHKVGTTGIQTNRSASTAMHIRQKDVPGENKGQKLQQVSRPYWRRENGSISKNHQSSTHGRRRIYNSSNLLVILGQLAHCARERNSSGYGQFDPRRERSLNLWCVYKQLYVEM